MYLCYADESGFSGSRHDPDQPVQVMVAILPNAYNFHRSDSEFRTVFDLMNDYVPVSELKCEQIYRGRGSWCHIPAHVRDQVIEFYLNWVSSRSHKFIVTAIDNGAFFALRAQFPGNPFIQAIHYPYLLAGLHTALVVQKMNRNQSRNKGKTILIFDEQDEFADDLTDLIFDPPDFIDDFVGFDARRDHSRLSQIIDTAFFVKSHQSSMAQVVDIVAHLFRLHIELEAYGRDEAYSGERDKVAGWISQIQPKFLPFSTVYPRKRTPFAQFLNSVKARGL